VQFQKDMQFQREFYFRLYRRVFSFLVTILAAWWLKSYWALVIGTLAMRGSGVVLSYTMHSMRPRWGTSKFREIFSVSQWMLVGNIAAFLEKRLHLLMVGRWSPVAVMGGYTLADEISEMPSGELLAPINRVLFPAFAKAAEDPVELKRLFVLAQSLQNFVALPAAIGLMMVAPEVIRVALGDKWAFATPFLQILALVNIGAAMVSSSGYVLIVLKKIHLTVVSKCLSLFMFGLLTFLFFRGAEAMVFAYLKLGTTILFSIGVQFWLLKRHLAGLRYRDLLLTFLRPAVACGVMAGGLYLISSHLVLPLVLALLVKLVAGAVLYGVAAIALWVLAGRPKGAESYVLDKLPMRYKSW
jgi:lipopolysaccharide exporter